MNSYGRMAQDHWGRFLPGQVAQMTDPTTFFEGLATQAATQVTELATELAGVDPSGESYLQKVGRLTNARQRAEEVTLRQLVLLPPEPGSLMDEDRDVDLAPDEPGAEPSMAIEGWHPVREAPGDPFWVGQES